MKQDTSKDITLWDINGKYIKKLSGNKFGISCMIFSNDGEKLISGGFDKDIRIWNIKSGKCIKKIGLPWYEKNFKF